MGALGQDVDELLDEEMGSADGYEDDEDWEDSTDSAPVDMILFKIVPADYCLIKAINASIYQVARAKKKKPLCVQCSFPTISSVALAVGAQQLAKHKAVYKEANRTASNSSVFVYDPEATDILDRILLNADGFADIFPEHVYKFIN
ncbi:hypothetical protein BDY19DRAFT_998846 [Irpex rosettiformis]|uniref:Uncharacterized protein n=1 Tax=Irpex rosettiformis TaxID=378272 RepID=A0ACB8TMA9_9APHY|nr:hypothetical protein BDY19DRAFT_998846 [Irpex rosettiformis]